MGLVDFAVWRNADLVVFADYSPLLLHVSLRSDSRSPLRNASWLLGSVGLGPASNLVTLQSPYRKYSS